MKTLHLIVMITLVLVCASTAAAQKTVVLKPVFAVANDGKGLEPIVFIENGKLKEIAEASETNGENDFVKKYYKPKTKYNLIFGGKTQGTVTVLKDLADSECARNQAEITVQSAKVKPKGFLMALATSAVPKKTVKGVREKPSWPERTAIANLVTAEFKAEGVPIKSSAELNYHNLTKIDVDSDGKFEFVGTYWYNTGPKLRSLLFFIAEKDAKGDIAISFKKFSEVKQEDVMSGDIKDIDGGVYHELLIDMFDYDGDGTSEIFTMSQAFEGSNFFAYKREAGIWKMVLETANYHCGY